MVRQACVPKRRHFGVQAGSPQVERGARMARMSTDRFRGAVFIPPAGAIARYVFR
ncbi:MAG: hypothetical protein QME74_10740 [Candidatus Edwardsbacteria bacterium]|nr:hypothetical protein [Candidatus Edwardsbacteria bacterium]